MSRFVEPRNSRSWFGPRSSIVRLFFLISSLLAVVVSNGCSTYMHRVAQVRDSYYANQLDAAQKIVAEAIRKDSSNADVLKLDAAVMCLAQGKPRDAEKTLREVRDHFDSLEDAIAKGTAMSYLTDDSHRTYSGEDYEKVLIRAFLALSNLMHDGEDAEAYSLQMIDKQERLIAAGVNAKGENPKQNYQRVALAPYLRGVLREATHLNYDDAERSYVSVVNWQPDFQSGRKDLARAHHGHHSAPGNGVVYVFALTGRGPCKVEAVEEPTTMSLMIAGEILGAIGSQTLPPNIAPVKVPKVVPQVQAGAAKMIEVGVNGRPLGVTETITDVTRLAIQQCEATHAQVLARAIARRCVKKGIVYSGKQASGMDKGSLVSLAVDLAGVAWEATETADTRYWGLLPDKIQVLRVELPAGQHELTLRPLISTNSAASPVTQPIRVANGRNTYVLANFPEARLVGKVVVSQP